MLVPLYILIIALLVYLTAAKTAPGNLLTTEAQTSPGTDFSLTVRDRQRNTVSLLEERVVHMVEITGPVHLRNLTKSGAFYPVDSRPDKTIILCALCGSVVNI